MLVTSNMTLSRPFFDNDCKCYKLRVAIYEAYRHCSLHGHAPSRGVLKPKSVRRRSPSGVTSTQSRTVGAKPCRRPTDFNFCSRRASFRGVYCRWDARIWGSKSASSGYGQRSRIPCMVYGRHRPGVSSSPLCELLILTSVLGLVSETGKICLPSFGRSRNRLFWVHALLSCLQELGGCAIWGRGFPNCAIRTLHPALRAQGRYVCICAYNTNMK